MTAGDFGVEFIVIVSSKGIIVNLKTPEDSAALTAFGGDICLVGLSEHFIFRSLPDFFYIGFENVAQNN